MSGRKSGRKKAPPGQEALVECGLEVRYKGASLLRVSVIEVVAKKEAGLGFEHGVRMLNAPKVGRTIEDSKYFFVDTTKAAVAVELQNQYGSPKMKRPAKGGPFATGE